MKAYEQKVLREVIHAMEVHFEILDNNLFHKARISQGNLRDIVDGMDISISKLKGLVKNA